MLVSTAKAQKTIWMRGALMATAATVGVGALTATPPANRAGDGIADRCTALVGTKLLSGRVDRAEVVAAGSFQPPSGQLLTNLPGFCRVVGTATPTAQSRIGFEVWLPLAGWDGRVHMVGNGGFSPEIRFNLLGNLIKRGAVAVATDTGHQGDNLMFGVERPEAIADWGHRAVHQSIDSGKRLIKGFYGRPPNYAYFSGCSTGGHQGLQEAQRYPNDFNGIISGDPGNNRTNLNLAFLWQFLQNHERGDNRNPILDRAALITVNREVIAQCDKSDGVLDGVVGDPRQCRFTIKATLCKPGQTKECLTPRQITAVQAIYGGPRRAGTGERLYPGSPPGSEFVTGQGASMGWDMYWSNPAKVDEPQRVDYFRHWVFHDPNWNWWNFDWDKDVDHVRAVMAPLTDAINPDLSAFRARGGKLIMFTGWQDPVVSPFDTIDYYEAVSARSGGLSKAQSFSRLYMVPGMEHCAGGPGATNFLSSTRDSPPLKSDAFHDMTLALEAWVEKGRAPAAIVAAKYANISDADGSSPSNPPISGFPNIDPDPTKRRVVFTRKLCPYPAVGTYQKGNPNLAASYACIVPQARKLLPRS